MSIHSAKYRLSSVKVTKNLINQLKSAIIPLAVEYLAKPEEETAKLLNVYIRENDNPAQTLEESDLAEGKLPDGTKEVIIVLSSLIDKLLHIKITFHSSISEHPVLEIILSDLKAKEISDRMAAPIIETVKKQRNANSFFHNRYIQVGLLVIYVVYSTWIYFKLCVWGDGEPLMLAKSFIAGNIFGIFVLWFIVSIFMRKYTAFDTKREKVILYIYLFATSLLVIIAGGYLYRVLSRM